MGKKKETRGRKKVEDKVVPLTIWVRESKIDELGGVLKARALLMDAIPSLAVNS